jgi:hypothetical protein
MPPHDHVLLTLFPHDPIAVRRQRGSEPRPACARDFRLLPSPVARRGAVPPGMATAAAALAAIGFATSKYGVRHPIGPFFAAPSALPALVAVVFTGHGVAAAAASPRWARAESAWEESTWLSWN